MSDAILPSLEFHLDKKLKVQKELLPRETRNEIACISIGTTVLVRDEELTAHFTGEDRDNQLAVDRCPPSLYRNNLLKVRMDLERIKNT